MSITPSTYEEVQFLENFEKNFKQVTLDSNLVVNHYYSYDFNLTDQKMPAQLQEELYKASSEFIINQVDDRDHYRIFNPDDPEHCKDPFKKSEFRNSINIDKLDDESKKYLEDFFDNDPNKLSDLFFKNNAFPIIKNSKIEYRLHLNNPIRSQEIKTLSIDKALNHSNIRKASYIKFISGLKDDAIAESNYINNVKPYVLKDAFISKEIYTNIIALDLNIDLKVSKKICDNTDDLKYEVYRGLNDDLNISRAPCHNNLSLEQQKFLRNEYSIISSLSDKEVSAHIYNFFEKKKNIISLYNNTLQLKEKFKTDNLDQIIENTKAIAKVAPDPVVDDFKNIATTETVNKLSASSVQDQKCGTNIYTPEQHNFIKKLSDNFKKVYVNGKHEVKAYAVVNLTRCKAVLVKPLAIYKKFSDRKEQFDNYIKKNGFEHILDKALTVKSGKLYVKGENLPVANLPYKNFWDKEFTKFVDYNKVISKELIKFNKSVSKKLMDQDQQNFYNSAECREQLTKNIVDEICNDINKKKLSYDNLLDIFGYIDDTLSDHSQNKGILSDALLKAFPNTKYEQEHQHLVESKRLNVFNIDDLMGDERYSKVDFRNNPEFKKCLYNKVSDLLSENLKNINYNALLMHEQNNPNEEFRNLPKSYQKQILENCASKMVGEMNESQSVVQSLAQYQQDKKDLYNSLKNTANKSIHR